MKVAAYIRVSTDDQSLSVEAQVSSLRALAVQLDLPEPTLYIDEGVSGATPFYERPAFAAMLESEPTHILATKRDRLTRDTMHGLFLEKEAKRRRIIILTQDAPSSDDPSSKFVRTLIDAFAEHERAMISQRTKVALQQLKAQGKKLGGCQNPYGTKPGEKEIIEVISSMIDTVWPRKIADHLNRLGYRTRKGNPFTSEDVRGIGKRHAS